MSSPLQRAFSAVREKLGDTWRSRVARNVAVVASGTAVAQGITMIFAPLITRLYGAEAFGLLGAFMALAAILTPIAALSYPMAIVLPGDDREALGLAKLSFVVSSAIVALVAITLCLWGDQVAALAGVEGIAGFILLIPLLMLFAAWLEIARNWLLRKQQFDMIARAAVAHSVVLNCAKAGIGWFHPLAAVLIVSVAIGQAVHAALLFLGAVRRSNAIMPALVDARPANITELASRHRDFPLYRSPQTLINSVSQSLPVLMLAGLFGPAASGFYALGRMVLGLPVGLISSAAMDVFYPRITKAAYAGTNLVRLMLWGTGALFLVGIIPFGIIMAFGPRLFSFAFGAEWGTAGEYARWLSLFFLFNFINKPSVAAVPVLRIQRGLLVYEVFSTGAKVLGLLAGFYVFDSDTWAVALFSVVGVIAYSVMMLWIFTCAWRWHGNAEAG